jgi:hypothetical protein
MEQVKSIPLYCVTIPRSIITIIEAPFITTLAHIVFGMRYKSQIPRRTELMNVHAKMPQEVNKVFVGQP